MKAPNHDLKTLKKILCQAYHEKENIEVGGQWQRNVMQRIRNLGPVDSRPTFFMLLEPFVWRLIPVTCLLIVVSAIILLKFDFTPQYELFTLLVDYTEESGLEQVFQF
jgi:hypothetical protein